jgi:hypothetical protein
MALWVDIMDKKEKARLWNETNRNKSNKVKRGCHHGKVADAKFNSQR